MKNDYYAMKKRATLRVIELNKEGVSRDEIVYSVMVSFGFGEKFVDTVLEYANKDFDRKVKTAIKKKKEKKQKTEIDKETEKAMNLLKTTKPIED